MRFRSEDGALGNCANGRETGFLENGPHAPLSSAKYPIPILLSCLKDFGGDVAVEVGAGGAVRRRPCRGRLASDDAVVGMEEGGVIAWSMRP